MFQAVDGVLERFVFIQRQFELRVRREDLFEKLFELRLDAFVGFHQLAVFLREAVVFLDDFQVLALQTSTRPRQIVALLRRQRSRVQRLLAVQAHHLLRPGAAASEASGVGVVRKLAV